jgi:hypothetical protein
MPQGGGDHGGGGDFASQFSGFPSQSFASHQAQHQQHTLESPYLYNVDPSRSHFARSESEAFPLPPSHSANSINRLAVPSNGNESVSPVGEHHSPTMIPQAHLQSFPFPMNPTPQLSDLINPQHYSPVAPAYQNGGGIEDGSPGSLHQISPVGGGPNLANGFGGGYPGMNPLTAANLAASSPQTNGRHPFDGQSALASPDRNGLPIGMNGDGLNGMKKGQNGEVVSTIWSAAELPEIDLMVEL